jgi:hypothetical protein
MALVDPNSAHRLLIVNDPKSTKISHNRWQPIIIQFGCRAMAYGYF